MLKEQLPRIGQAIPEIISGPYYKGVIGIGKGSITLSIIAECNEADYHEVQRALNRAVQELFAEKEIRIL
jgi:small conductance mechanosensitive channel